MMGKRKLCTGIILGAIVGGLTALTDIEARSYAKGKLSFYTSQTKDCLKNPSEAVRKVRISFDQFNEKFVSGAESTSNALAQVENTLAKVVKKKNPEQNILK